MDESSSFYLVLPANASPEEFPDNKNSTYKVRLAERLRLEGSKWECALVDMFYDNNWHNVKNASLTIAQQVPATDSARAQSILYTVEVREGRYESIALLIDEVNKNIDKMRQSNNAQILFDVPRDRAFLVLTSANVKVRMSENLAAVLGYKADIWYEPRQAGQVTYHESVMRPNLNQGFTSLMVYCNLAANRLVGHDLVPLLRVVPVRHNSGRTVYEEVRNPHYVSVTNSDTDVVEINIRRDDGSPIPFRGGKTIVTVHVRRRR